MEGTAGRVLLSSYMPLRSESQARCRVMICLLGEFRLLVDGVPLVMNTNGKVETLLRFLALRSNQSAPRDALLEVLWPESEAALAVQSMNSLVYALRKQIGGFLRGASPVLYESGSYHLNIEAGIGADIDLFTVQVEQGEQHLRQGEWEPAAAHFQNALSLYRGDLLVGNDTAGIIKREYLRAGYLSILNHLADYCLLRKEYTRCLSFTRQLLEQDPCRETAHRLAMLCYTLRGERASALRQFKLCQELLDREFHAVPEPATLALYEQIRLDPASFPPA